MSNVLRQIKTSDVYQRPFKAYKHYTYVNDNLNQGTVTQSAVWYGGRIDHLNQYYPENHDGTNQHVIWHSLKHRFYSDNTYSTPEHILNPLSERTFFLSASTLTIPYNDVGERIKNSTFAFTGSIGGVEIKLHDDGNGNLIDPSINSSSFASSSKCFFYMSFNDKFSSYRELDEGGLQFQNGDNSNTFSGSLSYVLNGQNMPASYHGNLELERGIQLTGSRFTGDPGVTKFNSGLSMKFAEGTGSQIRIPHHDVFNRFGYCDDWTISFWLKSSDTSGNISSDVILSKHGASEILAYNTEDNMLETVDQQQSNLDGTSISESRFRLPFHMTLASTNKQQTLFVEASDGTNNINCPSVPGLDAIFHGIGTGTNSWTHWTVRNSGSLLQIFANGQLGGFSGSLPQQPTANYADVTIGARTTKVTEARDICMAEFRMYDYAASNQEILSLANNNYISASCYQTNVVGNVFHRNGQVVVSSPIHKYHSGSGIFSSDYSWNAKWRGVHTIYENQVFVRLPKDVLNLTTNPTSTFMPPTDGGGVCTTNQNNILPGPQRKDLFVSGTLKPYITTIGLYNDNAELMAVAKLAQPIQKRDDVDMNFVVRWDY